MIIANFYRNSVFQPSSKDDLIFFSWIVSLLEVEKTYRSFYNSTVVTDGHNF